MSYANQHLLPLINDEQAIRKQLKKLMDELPDTFVLSRDNPLEYLTDKVNAIVAFYKTMSQSSSTSKASKLNLTVMQRQAAGKQRQLRTEVHICIKYVEVRRRQLERCNTYLNQLVANYQDILNFKTHHRLDYLTDQLLTMQSGMESYQNSCIAFNNTVDILARSVGSVDDLLLNILPSWDRQLANADRNNKTLEAEINKW